MLWLPVKQIPYPVKVTSSFNISSKILSLCQEGKNSPKIKTAKQQQQKEKEKKSYHEGKNKSIFLLKWAMKIISSCKMILKIAR